MTGGDTAQALLATRFTITREQLAAAYAVAELVPREPGVESTAVFPRQALLEAQVLHDDRTLRPSAEAALRIIAAPDSSLTVVSQRADAPWTRATFSMRDGVQGFAVREDMGAIVDVTYLPTANQAAVLIDEILMLTLTPAEAGPRFELSADGWTALLAATDALHAAELSAELERATELQPVALTPDRLQAQLRAGRQSPDSRWAVTAGIPITPVTLDRTASAIEAGIMDLVDHGLAVRVASGTYLSEAGAAVAMDFGRRIGAGALLRAEGGEGRAARVGTISVIRTPLTLWMGFWSDVAEQRGQVALLGVSHAGALEAVRRMLVPA